MKTLIARGHRQFGDQHFRHGEEIPPGLLPQEAIDWHLDRKELIEYDRTERRSLYGLFPAFSGCHEQEQLTENELALLGVVE